MARQKMINGNYAAIDIGSNAVRLLIKHMSENGEKMTGTKEQLIRVPLRLGMDVFTRGKITRSKEKKLCRLIASFGQLMQLYEVVDYRACATSAIRDAVNGKKVVAAVKKKTGVKINILSGTEEAQLIYNTHAEFVNERKENFMYVDVGGGSTEVNLIYDGRLVFSNSYNIGTIRLLSNTVDPEEWIRMKDDLTGLARTYSGVELLGSGGNINKLYRLVDNRDKKLQRMTVDSLKDLNARMNTLTLEERIRLFHLKCDRADVIVPASNVFILIAEMVGAGFIYVPTIGLSDGIIDEMMDKKRKKRQSRKKTDAGMENEGDTATADETDRESPASEHPEEEQPASEHTDKGKTASEHADKGITASEHADKEQPASEHPKEEKGSC